MTGLPLWHLMHLRMAKLTLPYVTLPLYRCFECLSTHKRGGGGGGAKVTSMGLGGIWEREWERQLSM